MIRPPDVQQEAPWSPLLCSWYDSCASPGRFEFSQSFRDSQSSNGSSVQVSELGSNMVYYYDDCSKVQMYTVDEKLLKEYIKRQM